LFGPRGTGKTTWTKQAFPRAARVDLLRSDAFAELIARPSRLESMVAGSAHHGVVVDEVQKAPVLLDEVHRLIEERGWRFVLTGSSARKLKRSGAKCCSWQLTNAPSAASPVRGPAASGVPGPSTAGAAS
jgi:predicted AAA+ superfamily ATPase